MKTFNRKLTVLIADHETETNIFSVDVTLHGAVDPNDEWEIENESTDWFELDSIGEQVSSALRSLDTDLCDDVAPKRNRDTQRGVTQNIRKFLSENDNPETWGHDAEVAQDLLRDSANVIDALLMRIETVEETLAFLILESNKGAN